MDKTIKASKKVIEAPKKFIRSGLLQTCVLPTKDPTCYGEKIHYFCGKCGEYLGWVSHFGGGGYISLFMNDIITAHYAHCIKRNEFQPVCYKDSGVYPISPMSPYWYSWGEDDNPGICYPMTHRWLRINEIVRLI